MCNITSLEATPREQYGRCAQKFDHSFISSAKGLAISELPMVEFTVVQAFPHRLYNGALLESPPLCIMSILSV